MKQLRISILALLVIVMTLSSNLMPTHAQTGGIVITASPASLSLAPGGQGVVGIKVSNNSGSSDTFNISAQASAPCGIAANGITSPVDIANGGTSTQENITITVEASATPNTTCKVLVHAEGHGDFNRRADSEILVNITRPTATPNIARPVLEVAAYAPEVTAPGDYTLNVTLKNTGPVSAYNIMATFTGAGDIVPIDTGGLVVKDELPSGTSHTFTQSYRLMKAVTTETIFKTYLTLDYDGPDGALPSQPLQIPITVTPATPTEVPGGPTQPSDLTRPVLQIRSYFNVPNPVLAGSEFDMVVNLVNTGGKDAKNVFVRFEGGGILPRDTGGLIVAQEVKRTETAEFKQPMIQVGEVAAAGSVPITANVSYMDEAGEKYTESFTLALPVAVKTPAYSGQGWATATPTGTRNAQFMVSKVTTSIDPLQPGTVFDLTLEIHNLGNADARNVTMALGGATESVDNSSGTPQPAGVSAGSSDLSKFAPLGSSNLVYLGDVPNGAVLIPVTKLVVNVNTDPGAYPLKLSFIYTDAKNNRKVDDQVITLLVYSLPKLEVSFYMEPQPFMPDMPGQLPIQITNLGKKNVVLGNVVVSSDAGTIQNGKSLVGSLDPGGYFTLDAMLMAQKSGPGTITVTIEYNDDFSQPRTFSKKLDVTVSEPEPTPDPAMNPEGMGMPGESMPQPETLWQKVVRLFKGLLGLGSDSPDAGMDAMPPEMMPDAKPMPGG